jgi:hypothetical protein
VVKSKLNQPRSFRKDTQSKQSNRINLQSSQRHARLSCRLAPHWGETASTKSIRNQAQNSDLTNAESGKGQQNGLVGPRGTTS